MDAIVSESPPAHASRWPTAATVRKALPVLLTLIGGTALFFLIRGAHWSACRAAFISVAPALPFIFALEVLRCVAEARATLTLYGSSARLIPTPVIIRAQLSAYTANMLLPAGRATGETLKALLLSPLVGVGRAAGVAAVAQALALIAVSIAATPYLIAAICVHKGTPLAIVIGVHCVVTSCAGIALLTGVRHPRLLNWLGKKFPRAAPSLTAAREAIASMPTVQFGALAWLVVSQWIPLAEFTALLVVSRTAGFGRALLCQGASDVGAALGDWVPGHVGATDGALALAAPIVRISLATALALTATLHGVQVLCALAASVATLMGQASKGGRSTSTLPLRFAEPALSVRVP